MERGQEIIICCVWVSHIGAVVFAVDDPMPKRVPIHYIQERAARVSFPQATCPLPRSHIQNIKYPGHRVDTAPARSPLSPRAPDDDDDDHRRRYCSLSAATDTQRHCCSPWAEERSRYNPSLCVHTMFILLSCTRGPSPPFRLSSLFHFFSVWRG